MEDIRKRLDGKNHEQLREVLELMVATYCNPSFGSISKHDIDLLMFDSLVRLGFISDNPTIYDVMRDLKITRSKARNLIYEYQLRKIQNQDQLKNQLIAVLKTPLLSKVSNYVFLEVDNPYLVDYIRNELKHQGYVTDGSFHVELVKMTTEAFVALYMETLSKEKEEKISKELVKLGVKKDVSLKQILPSLIQGVAKSFAKSVLGKVGEDIADECFKFLKDIINVDKDKEAEKSGDKKKIEDRSKLKDLVKEFFPK